MTAYGQKQLGRPNLPILTMIRFGQLNPVLQSHHPTTPQKRQKAAPKHPQVPRNSPIHHALTHTNQDAENKGWRRQCGARHHGHAPMSCAGIVKEAFDASTLSSLKHNLAHFTTEQQMSFLTPPWAPFTHCARLGAVRLLALRFRFACCAALVVRSPRFAWLPCGAVAALPYGICDGWVLGFAGKSGTFRRKWFVFGGRMRGGCGLLGFPRVWRDLGGFPRGLGASRRR